MIYPDCRYRVRRSYVYRLAALFLVFFCFFSSEIFAQSSARIQGKVYDRVSGKALDFATVAVLETRQSMLVSDKGDYAFDLSSEGEYTLIVRSQGYKIFQEKIRVSGKLIKDIYLEPLTIRGRELVIRGKRDIQKVSRYTMTSRDMKEVPASFGDSVSALTSLPGVIRTNGFFGPLIIRGAESNVNRYFIDDIPVYNPQHFGGIHSVISSDLMSEIDLYASAFPAQFGGAIGSVIDINTVDDVKKFGGVADVGLISSNIYVASPLKGGPLSMCGPDSSCDNSSGYCIASGRIGYLSVFIPPIYELVTGDELDFVPEYWDYQLKWKYFFDSKHSVTLLLFGSKDYITYVSDSKPPDEIDPLFENLEFKSDLLTNSMGLYYAWQPSTRFANKIMAYSTLTDSYNYINIDDDAAASWVKGLNIKSKPYIYGLKEEMRAQWLPEKAEIRTAVEAVIYDFRTEGNSLIPKDYAGTGMPDFANEDEFVLEPLEGRTVNKTLGFYAENKFTFGSFTFLPGIRTDYLQDTGQHTFDYRGMASYEFATGTTISLAGGKYSYFFQTNPYLFNYAPQYASMGDEVKPEKAIHRVAGIEQEIGLVTVEVEGFYNTFYDLAQPDADLPDDIASTGKMKTWGFEIMIRLDRRENKNGPFGWVNYTYTRSKRKSGLPLNIDEYGDRYLTFNAEQKHAFKLVAGYTHNNHSISARFQYYTSLPYTPISGSVESPPGSGRYVPVYDNVEPNSSNFPASHRLDVRYSYRTPYEWGHVSWYIEVINIYNYQPIDSETWDYTQPYQKGVNPVRKSDEGLNFIPNFGVEIKF